MVNRVGISSRCETYLKIVPRTTHLSRPFPSRFSALASRRSRVVKIPGEKANSPHLDSPLLRACGLPAMCRLTMQLPVVRVYVWRR